MIKLTEKEITRADETYLGGRKYTVITRPHSTGKTFVAVVWLDTGEIYDSTLADSKADGIKSILRFMDKNGCGGQMADASRERT